MKDTASQSRPLSAEGEQKFYDMPAESAWERVPVAGRAIISLKAPGPKPPSEALNGGGRTPQ